MHIQKSEHLRTGITPLLPPDDYEKLLNDKEAHEFLKRPSKKQGRKQVLQWYKRLEDLKRREVSREIGIEQLEEEAEEIRAEIKQAKQVQGEEVERLGTELEVRENL